MLDIHERRADAYIHKHPRPPGLVAAAMWTALATMSESELLRHSFCHRGGGAAWPRHFLRTLLLHDASVVRVQREERFLNLERRRRRRDRSPMRRGDHQRDQKRMQRADNGPRPTPPLLNVASPPVMIESLFSAGGYLELTLIWGTRPIDLQKII